MGVVKSGGSRSKEEIYLRPPVARCEAGDCVGANRAAASREIRIAFRRKYEIRQVSAEGGEIGLIAGDKYGSRGQLAHTLLLSLGEWGLPLSPLVGSGFCPPDNAANFARLLHNFIQHMAT